MSVVVVGGGPGGIGAAVQASREGARVTLVEELPWVGGQMTAAGVSTMDEGNLDFDRVGVYADFAARVRAHYSSLGKSVGTCYHTPTSLCFEPSVGERILREILAEAGVRVLTGVRVLGVKRWGNRVTGVITEAGEIEGVVVDATEFGDLMPLAGVDYLVGNGRRGDPRGCVQDVTYVAVVKRYPGGVPQGLRVTSPVGPRWEDDLRVFRQLVRLQGEDWWRSGRYGAVPVGWKSYVAYRGLPNSSEPGDCDASPGRAEMLSKTCLNFGNDYPGYYEHRRDRGEVFPAEAVEDLGKRREHLCAAKVRTLNLLYYLQVELGLPWSVADDEFPPWGEGCPGVPEELRGVERRLALSPYVREGRRLAGVHVLSAREVERGRCMRRGRNGECLSGYWRSREVHWDSVGVGTYPMDLHNCHWTETLEGEDSGERGRAGPFTVPLGTLIPREVEGFTVAEKNISQTRLVNGATRLQPVAMRLGQAVGALAALAVTRGIGLRDVRPIEVQDVLVREGIPVSPYWFADVPRDHERWGDVQIATVRGIMAGYQEEVEGPGEEVVFGVHDPLTEAQLEELLEGLLHGRRARVIPPGGPAVSRSEAARALVRALGLGGKGQGVAEFADVPPDHEAHREVQVLSVLGLMGPCQVRGGIARFCPDQELRRGEAAGIVRSYLMKFGDRLR